MTEYFGLYFSPVYASLILAILVYVNSNKGNRSKRWLAFLLFNISFMFLGLVFFFVQDYKTYSPLLSSNVAAMLLIFPSYYIYIDLLITKKKIRAYYIHLFPAIISFIVTSLFYFGFLNNEEQIYFLTTYRYNPDFKTFGLTALFIIRVLNLLTLFGQVFYYGFLIRRIIRRYHDLINDNFSNTEGIEFNNTRVLNFLLVVSSFACVGFYSINPIKVFNTNLVVIVPLLFLSVIICTVGIVGLRQKPLPPINVDKQLPECEDSNLEMLYLQIELFFKSEKPYLNQDLKMEDIEKIIGTNRSYLSASINKHGYNFNEFVNGYRIQECLRLMKDEKYTKASDLFCLVGFGSLSSFNRSFVKVTGVTFAKYLKSVISEA